MGRVSVIAKFDQIDRPRRYRLVSDIGSSISLASPVEAASANGDGHTCWTKEACCRVMRASWLVDQEPKVDILEDNSGFGVE
jgi:hypothetical protein